MIIEGQVHGGLTDGVGMALMEIIAFDEDGNCLGGSLMDYLIPTALEVPDWETGFTVTPSPHHPIGAKGIGESATVGSPPAIVNAVVDALEAVRRAARRHAAHSVPRVGRHAGPRRRRRSEPERNCRWRIAWPLGCAELTDRHGCRSCTPRSCAPRSRPRPAPATTRSCWPTARSRDSSVANAPRGRCASPRSARCATARPCCCGCCRTARRAFPRVARAPRSWSTLPVRRGAGDLPGAAAAAAGARRRRHDADRRRAWPRIAEMLGFDVRRALTGTSAGRRHGRDRVQPRARRDRGIRAALDAGVGYIGLVASPRAGRGRARRARPHRRRARPHPHAGRHRHRRPDRAEEIALSIMAEVVRAVRLDGLHAPAPSPDAARGEPAAPREALDPVCGMTVTVTPGHAARSTSTASITGSARRAAGTSTRHGPGARARRDGAPPTRRIVRRRLDEIDYLVDDGMATALFLALTLGQPLLLEGEPGRRQDGRREGAGPGARTPR